MLIANFSSKLPRPVTGDPTVYADVARAMQGFHAAILGPGYFLAQERVHGEWQSFAGGPSWLAVDALSRYRGDNPTRALRREVRHG